MHGVATRGRSGLPRARAGGLSRSATKTGAMADFDVRLFGRFRLFRDGEEIKVPHPQGAKALKLLVLNGGVVHEDRLAAALWPADQPGESKTRLRNVFSRLRQETGAKISRRNTAVILDDTFRCDIIEFIERGTRAASGIDGREESYRLCVEVESLWAGPPLEEDRYEPWADEARQRAYDVQSRVWAMLGTVHDPEWPPSRSSRDDRGTGKR
jgi:DNA-binding SARP family transcriptional activator